MCFFQRDAGIFYPAAVAPYDFTPLVCYPDKLVDADRRVWNCFFAPA
jgi:hypothetical protein